MEFVLIENQCGHFYLSVINARSLEEAYEQAETLVSSPWLHYVVPLNEVKEFILNHKKVHRHLKGGG